MNKHISLNVYRMFDIFVFSILGILFEFLSVKLLSIYEYPYFYLSLSVMISVIIMKRWNKFCFLFPLIIGLFYAFLINGRFETYFIYGIGNSFILFNLIFLKKIREGIDKNNFLNILFIINAFVLTIFGRSLIAFVFGFNFLNMLIAFFGTELLNVLFSVIIIFLLKRIDGVYEDQVNYIKRVNLEVRYEA